MCLAALLFLHLHYSLHYSSAFFMCSIFAEDHQSFRGGYGGDGAGGGRVDCHHQASGQISEIHQAVGHHDAGVRRQIQPQASVRACETGVKPVQNCLGALWKLCHGGGIISGRVDQGNGGIGGGKDGDLVAGGQGGSIQHVGPGVSTEFYRAGGGEHGIHGLAGRGAVSRGNRRDGSDISGEGQKKTHGNPFQKGN